MVEAVRTSLGLDVSSSSTGWAVVDDRLTLLECGLIAFKHGSQQRLGKRLNDFRIRLWDVLEKYKDVTYMVVEDTYMAKNVATTKLLNKFSGVTIQLSEEIIPKASRGILAPQAIRSAIFPKQKSDKELVYQHMAKKYPQIVSFPGTTIASGKHKGEIINDVTDAIAMACYPFLKKIPEGNLL